MFRLYNGIEIPKYGLGATIIPFGKEGDVKFEQEYEFYKYAINMGGELFDTSAAYGKNDEALGLAVHDLNKRTNVKIMTKVSNEQQRKGTIRRDFEAHLKYLRMEYVDYYLIHWPQTGTFVKTYLEMEKLYDEGLIKAIGVCNCNIHHLKELETFANIKPMINQIEITPIFTQDALINYCKAFDIMPISYSPTGRMHDCIIKSEPIRMLSEKYRKSPVQVILKWNEQLGRPALVQTRNRYHFEEIFRDNNSFELTKKEIYWINSVNNNTRLRYDPDMADFSVL